MRTFTLNKTVRGWLISMGYTLIDKSEEAVNALFLKEARQWGMTPHELALFVKETRTDRQPTRLKPQLPAWTVLAEV